MWNNSDEFEIEEEEIKIFKKRKQSKRNNKGYRKIKIRIRRAKNDKNSRGINKRSERNRYQI